MVLHLLAKSAPTNQSVPELKSYILQSFETHTNVFILDSGMSTPPYVFALFSECVLEGVTKICNYARRYFQLIRHAGKMVKLCSSFFMPSLLFSLVVVKATILYK
jgi:hypothetical protein